MLETDAWLFGVESLKDTNKIQLEIELGKGTTDWIRRNFDKKKIKVCLSVQVDADE
jgi:hypothetical protein